MVFIRKRGDAISVEGALDTSDETLDKLRDLMMLQCDTWGLTVRDIARLLRMPKSTVHRRLKTIPPRAREHYEKSIRRLARPGVLS